MKTYKYIISTNNTTLTEGMRNSIEEKFMFLDDFLKKGDYIRINISIKNHIQSIRIMFNYLSNEVILSAEDEDLYIAIDKLKDKVKLKITKINKKTKERKKNSLNSMVYTNTLEEDDDDFNKCVVKRKEFFLKPMSEEEAILQMELLNHNSFMFINADLSFKMCLLYKRKDGNYGIIESQIRDR